MTKQAESAHAASQHRDAWIEYNLRTMSAALDLVRQALQRHIDRSRKDPARSQSLDHDQLVKPAALIATTGASNDPSALEQLCADYSLSAFERDLLVLCAGIELDSEFHAACGVTQGIKGRALPTFGLALAALPEPHWSALAPHASLRRGGLIQVLPGDSLTQSPLRIDERVLHFLTRVTSSDCLDTRLRTLLFQLPPPAPLPPAQRQLVEYLIRRVALGEDTDQCVLLCGPDAVARSAVAAVFFAELGIALYCMNASEVPTSAADRELFIQPWEREVRLEGYALLVQFDDAAPASGEARRAAMAFIERVPGLVLLSSEDPVRSSLRRILRFDVPHLSPAKQRAEWRAALGSAAPQHSDQIDQLVGHSSLGQQAISTITEEALALVTDANAEPTVAAKDLGRALWAASRAQARPHLDDLAQRIDSRASWNDLVLPTVRRGLSSEGNGAAEGYLRPSCGTTKISAATRHRDNGRNAAALLASQPEQREQVYSE